MGKMKDCILLDNSMFDDGSIECKNFQVSTQDDYYICEWDHINLVFINRICDGIKKAIAEGKNYITLDGEFKHYDSSIVEISWD